MVDQERRFETPDMISGPVDAGDTVGGLNGRSEVTEDAGLSVEVFEFVVPGKKAVGVGELVVDFSIDAVSVKGVWGRTEKITDIAAAIAALVGIGVVLDQVGCDGTKSVGRDDVAGEGIADVSCGAGRASWIEAGGAWIEDLNERPVG